MSDPNLSNPEILCFTVNPQYNGSRLDQCLAKYCPDRSRSRLQDLIREGYVRINGEICTVPKRVVSNGMLLEVENIPDEIAPQNATPENIPLDVLYEDGSMLVINKSPGMVVHPAAGNWNGTVVNALLGRDPGIGSELAEYDPLRPGIVHRLDKDTSGCLVIAKTPNALARLSASFAERKTSKTYLAIVCGHPEPPHAEIKNLIGRHPVDRKKMAVVQKNGREAHSVYTVVRQGEILGAKAALVEVRIYTGRTHQIRVHMASIGHPVAGDPVYGGAKRLPAERQMLHAWHLSIPHPETGEMLSFEAPPPRDFDTFLKQMQ